MSLKHLAQSNAFWGKYNNFFWNGFWLLLGTSRDCMLNHGTWCDCVIQLVESWSLTSLAAPGQMEVICENECETKTQVHLPASNKAKLMRKVLVRTAVYSSASHLKRWRTLVPKPVFTSQCIRMSPRHFYRRERETEEIEGRGLKSSLHAD